MTTRYSQTTYSFQLVVILALIVTQPEAWAQSDMKLGFGMPSTIVQDYLSSPFLMLWTMVQNDSDQITSTGPRSGSKAAADNPNSKPEKTPEPPTKPKDDLVAKPQLVVPWTDVSKSRFPVVDIHTHFWVKGKHDPELLKHYVEMMDRNNIAVSISLDGTLPLKLDEHCQFLWKENEHRFVIFGNMDFQGTGVADQPSTWACNQADFVRHQVEMIREAVRSHKISGLKIFKDFGLRYRNSDGSLIAIDDSRFSPIWAVCGELGLPVIMHSADPSAFFEAISESNERFRELSVHPEWSFASSEFPTRQELHEARNRVIERHPNTNFIAAHFGNDAEDLAQLSGWLDQYPNLHIEFASRINELGRQPYSSRRFFEKYQDRIMLGTDGPWPEARLRLYWRFLETLDEYFPYSEKIPAPQGDWRIYGIALRDDVLRKVYFLNASKLIPGVQERLSKYDQRPTK